MPKRKNKQYEREQKAIADRKELILKLYTVDGRKQSEIADMFRMSRSRVNEIVKESSIDNEEVKP
ncbi:MAG: hypothetical protein C0436_00635 [Alphaproteobacteria bacterium]|nr:hypothetical protein [Alphaproteobacteria bacterium]